MGADDDKDCSEHQWVLHELRGTTTGMERTEKCELCGAIAFVPGQAAVRDTRPPL